jgi:hypothetical protein
LTVDYFHNATDSAASAYSTEDYDDLPERPTLSFSVDELANAEGPDLMHARHHHNQSSCHGYSLPRATGVMYAKESVPPVLAKACDGYDQPPIAMFAPSNNGDDLPQPYALVKKVARIVGSLLQWRSPQWPAGEVRPVPREIRMRWEAQQAVYDFQTGLSRPHAHRHCDARPPVSAPIYERNFTLPTLLTNTTLNVTVSKYRVPAIPGAPSAYFTRIVAGGRIVALADGVANNGAVHIVNRVLNPLRGKTPPGSPRKGPHRHYWDEDQNTWVRLEDEDANEWEGWEDWLVRWALDE